VIFLFWGVVALAFAGVHILRHKEPRTRENVTEWLLVYWLMIAIGLGGIVGGLYHVFDGKQIAEEIGFTRGDGGFQFENAMGDIAIGVAAFLSRFIRDPMYWLAILIVATISLWGDGYGHIYQAIEYDNHDPDNTGIVLYTDFLYPLIGIVLYALWWRARRLTLRPAPGG
jgi:uncharacterized protein DUF6790